MLIHLICYSPQGYSPCLGPPPGPQLRPAGALRLCPRAPLRRGPAAAEPRRAAAARRLPGAGRREPTALLLGPGALGPPARLLAAPGGAGDRQARGSRPRLYMII